MFLLITGASGMGKTTVRKIVAPQFVDKLESAELTEASDDPFDWSLRWRHQAIEKAVQRAAESPRCRLCKTHGTIAVTRISIRIVGSPSAATPTSVQIGAWLGM